MQTKKKQTDFCQIFVSYKITVNCLIRIVVRIITIWFSSFQGSILSLSTLWSNCYVGFYVISMHATMFSRLLSPKKNWKCCIVCNIIVTTERNSKKNDKKWNFTFLKVTENYNTTLLPPKQNKQCQSVVYLLYILPKTIAIYKLKFWRSTVFHKSHKIKPTLSF